MDFILILTIFAIGFFGSFISGMLGVGGSIVNYPLLLFIPAALGVAHFTSHEVSGITAVQVFFGSISGVLAYRKGGYLNKKVIGYMGVSVLAGSLIGGLLSSEMSETFINVIYGVLALAAVVLMMVPHHRSGSDATDSLVHFKPMLASSLSFVIGLGAGIVGAGGAFLLVPVMLTILRLPTRMTIACSLAITFLSSAGSAGSKVFTGQVLFLPALIMVAASLIASPLGARVGQKLNTKYLEWALAALIFLVAVKIWSDLLF